VAKHHRRNRGRLAAIGPIIALALMAAAVVTVWLLLSDAQSSVDSTDDANAVVVDDDVETVEQVDPTTTTSPEAEDLDPSITTAAENEAATETPADSIAETTTTTTTTTTIPDFVAGQRAIAFDPLGGDGEHDDLAVRALDGDLTTFWNTQSYRTRTFGNIKEGVGLVVEFEQPQSFTQLSVSTDRVGWAARVYLADSVAENLDGWGSPVGSFSELATNAVLDIPDGNTSAVLLWVTDLGVDPAQSVEDYDAQVAEGGFDQRLVINEIVLQG